MKITTYLNFDGKCEAAFRFYERCLGAKIINMMTHGESPMAGQVSPEWRDKVMHACLQVDDQILMGSDASCEHYQRPAGMYVSLGIAQPADADRIFQALGENGQIQMPIQKTFWSARFGMLTDQFGIPWMINCEQAA